MVRTAIEQMSAILGDLQIRLGRTTDTDEYQCGQDTGVDKQQVVDMHIYMEKCHEFEQLKAQYVAKCRDYEQLSDKHRNLKASNTRPPEVVTSKQSTAVRQPVLPMRLQTFEDFEAVEESMMAPGSGSRGRRSIAVSPPNALRMQGDMAGMKHRTAATTDVTPTKRARKAANPPGDALPRLLSSPLSGPCRPLLHKKQCEWKRAGSKEERKHSTKPTVKPRPLQSGKQPVLLSSQETQLDFSDLVLPTGLAESVEQLCPPSDQECNNNNIGSIGNSTRKIEERDEMWRAAVKQEVIEGNKKVEDWVEKTREFVGSAKDKPKVARGDSTQNDKDLQRILEAVSDCEECKAFYSVPGLVLPKRDPNSLCVHRSRARKSKDGSVRNSRALEAPRSEQKRPTTPDHFWDIDYFPPIRTGGPEMLRKNKQH
ncbi:hypothetical protein IW140_001681 [Coemansia sp. RSA 1813]|nr:hypothetical protein EV178_001477 [Coemansia sp. RSA 1646]KAJ1772544.1 hypothetical protein LPJ74_001445 [Coemansia sp. RSA 1843]KAJ2090947.1 hypothetical protein IW138_002351 [Coemansia sp. RSA 986]KAJ2213985.1 hypothetical protein EV179_003340 [Coemansia sp. RSA 487]KAJ2571227.1 hypothetical protein IW140_001681 [Coemansia sp. RSA 1813]